MRACTWRRFAFLDTWHKAGIRRGSEVHEFALRITQVALAWLSRRVPSGSLDFPTYCLLLRRVLCGFGDTRFGRCRPKCVQNMSSWDGCQPIGRNLGWISQITLRCIRATLAVQAFLLPVPTARTSPRSTPSLLRTVRRW